QLAQKLAVGRKRDASTGAALVTSGAGRRHNAVASARGGAVSRLTPTRIALVATNNRTAKCRKFISASRSNQPGARWLLFSSRSKRVAPSTKPLHRAATAPAALSRR